MAKKEKLIIETDQDARLELSKLPSSQLIDIIMKSGKVIVELEKRVNSDGMYTKRQMESMYCLGFLNSDTNPNMDAIAKHSKKLSEKVKLAFEFVEPPKK